MAYLANMSHESALIRRSSAACLVIISRYSRYPLAMIRFLMTTAIDQLLEHHHQTDSVRVLNGYLTLLKNLIQLLGVNMDELMSSSINFQQPLNTSKNIEPNEQHLPVTIRQIIEVRNFILRKKKFFIAYDFRVLI